MTWDRSERNVRWGLLYATALLLIGLCGLIEVFVPTGVLRAILQIVTVMMGFGLMALWVLQSRHSTTERRRFVRAAPDVGNQRACPVAAGRRIVSASVDG